MRPFDRFLRGVVVLVSTIVGLTALALLALCAYGIAVKHVGGLIVGFLLCALVLRLAYVACEWALRPWIAGWNGRRAFYVIVACAIGTSVLICAAHYALSVRQLHSMQENVAAKRIELGRLSELDREVRIFQATKTRLQSMIDLINSLKRNQRDLSPGVQAVAALGHDAALIDGISISPVFDPTKKTSVSIVFYSHAPEASLDGLARRLGAEKHVQPNGSFTLAVTR